MKSSALETGLLTGVFALAGVVVKSVLDGIRGRAESNRERVTELRDVFDAGAVALGEALYALSEIWAGIKADPGYAVDETGSQKIDDFGRRVADSRTVQHRLRVRLGREDPLCKSYARPSNQLSNIHNRLFAASNGREHYSAELLERDAAEVREAREAFFTAAAGLVGPEIDRHTA